MNMHRVTDSRGEVHIKKTVRTYTHAVVAHLPANVTSSGGVVREASTKASWASTHRLALREAKRWEGKPMGFQVEVLEAERAES